jgi:hypothetical protein
VDRARTFILMVFNDYEFAAERCPNSYSCISLPYPLFANLDVTYKTDLDG